MNVESFTKDNQTVANEFNRLYNSVGKSTTEKIQLLARKFNYVPTQDPCILKNYHVSEFSHDNLNCLVFLVFCRDAGPRCPVDNESLTVSQVFANFINT